MVKDKSILHIVLYVIFVAALSALFLLLHFLFKNVGAYDVSFPQFAPVVAVLLVLIIGRDKAIAKETVERVKITKKSLWVSGLCAVTIGVVFVLSGLVLSALNRQYSAWQPPLFAVNLLLILVGCITEEIGWRGFLLPNLHKKMSLLLASVVLGALWGVWHLNFADGILGFFVYCLFTVTLSVPMSWVQIKCSNKIFPAVIIHFCVNVFTRVLLYNRVGWLAYLIVAGFFAVIGVVLFLIDKRTFLTRAES